MNRRQFIQQAAMAGIGLSAAQLGRGDEPRPAEDWIPLFNGHDLDGWIPKIRGFPAGENFGDTFRVVDGLLTVAYDAYETFDGRFGHLFYGENLSHYRLRTEYRFIGTQVPGGPDWALRNSGLMVHGQTPQSMAVEQEFPVSIEVQLLGGDGTTARPTLNLCTPGTHVVMNGELFTPHCVNSSSRTYHGDQWVISEVEVRGNDIIRHVVDGDVVLTYEQPQLDDGDPDAQKLLAGGQPRALSAGTISLQSESHPIQFRRVELLRLDA